MISVTAGLFFVSIVFLLVFMFLRQRSLKNEIEEIIVSQTLLNLANLQNERRASHYLRIKNVLSSSPKIESLVLYDKNCKLLTSTFLNMYDQLKCPDVSSIKLVSYPDVLSEIGYVAFRIHPHKFYFSDYVSMLFTSSLLTFFLIGLMLGLWNFLIYKPLIFEIESVEKGKIPQFKELGGLGEKVQNLIVKNGEYEKDVVRISEKEKRAKEACKVAHDILHPVSVLKQFVGHSDNQAISDAIFNIENIAYDLLPEKSPIVLGHHDPRDLLLSLKNQVKYFGDTVRILPILGDSFNVLTSKPHFLRAVINLIKNAIEASPTNEAIQLSFETKNNSAILKIIDRGKGYDGTNTITTKSSGSGLGIESTRNILSALHASLEYSRNPKGGTIASVIFPLNPKKLEGQYPVWLVEDDKYVRISWEKSAKMAGVELTVFDALPDTTPKFGTIVYLDRFLGDIDTSSWGREAIRQGAQVHSISGIGFNSKKPPWVSIH
jgi:hypothetical protein